MGVALFLAMALVHEANVGQSEGPASDGKGNLYFTSKGRIMRRDPSGKVGVFREDAQANGLMFDKQGRLVMCESGRRRVTRLEPNGDVTVLADSYEGKRFNTPNDLAMDAKGRIYFSDPRYGDRSDMEMPEGVYRIDAPGKVTRILAPPAVDRPNGLIVSRGDKFLYVADNNNNTVGGSRKLLRFDLKGDGTADPSTRKVISTGRTAAGPTASRWIAKRGLYVAVGRNKANKFETADEFRAESTSFPPKARNSTSFRLPTMR
jgi:gluconolactonase